MACCQRSRICNDECSIFWYRVCDILGKCRILCNCSSNKLINIRAIDIVSWILDGSDTVSQDNICFCKTLLAVCSVDCTICSN